MGDDVLMSEFEEVSSVIVNETGKDANIIMGVIIDENLAGKISVTIIATGLSKADNIESDFSFPRFDIASPSKSMKDETNYIAEPTPDDILKKLDLYKPEKNDVEADESNAEINRIKALRTDVPSFLKALD